MKKKINQIAIIFFVVLAITVTILVTNVNAANLKENTNPNDTKTDTITDGTIIIGVSKFTPGTVVTGVKAAVAGSNDMKVYALTKGDTDGYEAPKMYYYVLGEWMQYDEEGGLKGINAIDSLDIYYVNNQLKNGISLPTPPSKPSTGGSTSRPVQYTVFFMTGEEQYSSVTVNSGSKINELPTVESDDPTTKKFGGWKTKDGEVITKDTPITSSMVLFPKWNGPAGIEIVFNDGKPNQTYNGFVEDYVATDILEKENVNGVEYSFAGLSIGEETYEGYTIEDGKVNIKIPEPIAGSNTTISVNWTKKVTAESLASMEANQTVMTIDGAITFAEENMAIPSTVETLNIEGIVTLPNNITIGENVKTINIGANADVTIAPSINFADDATVTKETNAIVKQQVNDETTLQNAIAKTYVDEIILINNVSLTASLEITSKTIDLAEKTINAEGIASGYAITTNGNASLKNGTITTGNVSGENKARAIYNTAGTLDLENMTVNGYYGITSDDGAGLVTIKNSTLNTEFAGVYAATGASVKVDNSTINSNIYGLSGNGTKSNTTYEVLNGSTITSKTDAAIYFPSTITLNVTDSTVSGKVGIEACAGNINVKNSTITATETNAYTDEEIKAKFDTKANGTFIDDRSSGSAIFFRIQKPYGSNTTASINVDANSTLNGTYGIRVYESSTSTNTDAVKELTIDSLVERNDEKAISIYRVAQNAIINYSKTAIDLTQGENNIATKSANFNSTYYNKVAEQTITTVDEDTYYVDLGTYTGKANPTELYIEGHKYGKDEISVLSVGNNSKIKVPVWKINAEGNVLIALPWLCAEALPSSETTVVVGGQTLSVTLYDSEVDGTLTLTDAGKFATKEGEVHNVSITGENEVTIERSYKTEGVKVTFSKNNTPILDEAEYVYRMDNKDRMKMAITHPEDGATYAVFLNPYKKASVTKEITNTYSYKIAIPGKGVTGINLICKDVIKN